MFLKSVRLNLQFANDIYKLPGPCTTICMFKDRYQPPPPASSPGSTSLVLLAILKCQGHGH